MGLDMYIFKLTKEVEVTEKQKEQLSNIFDKEFGKEVDKLTPILKDDCIEHLKKFDVLITEKDIEIVISNLIESMWITDKESMYNVLFNYFPVYEFFILDKQQAKIYLDFMLLKTKVPLNRTLVSLYKKYQELNALDIKREKLAYWRKYHDLNSYILETYGGGNCEDTTLSLEDLKDIKKFIKNDNKDTTQIDKIISNFDNECTYVYNPWW
jgi:hypothetical protein